MNADEIAEAFFRNCNELAKSVTSAFRTFLPAQFEMLASRFPMVTNQVECSLLHLAPIYDGSFDLCQRLRVVPMVWSALAGGRLLVVIKHRSRNDCRPAYLT